MRVLGFVALGLIFSCQAFALEAAAGADTVNTSQVGIDAKLNAITTASINLILARQKAGKLYAPSPRPASPLMSRWRGRSRPAHN